MAGGTVLISREVNNHAYFKKRFEDLGFPDVTPLALERDALYSKIHELNPTKILMSARYYQCCTPFLMGQMCKEFPEIKMAALCLGEYPPDIAMYFILNGIKSYFTSFEGYPQFYKGIDEFAKGREYVSPAVTERIKMRLEYPPPAGKITRRHKEILRLICCGFKDGEIAEVLALSRNTIIHHKTDIFRSLNVRNPVELIRAVLTQEILRLEELYFYPKDYTLNPIPDIKIKGRRKNEK
jgi:DNA-binding CsgD family transcriptional regulator